MSEDTYRDYLADPDTRHYQSYDDWKTHRSQRRAIGLPPTEGVLYIVDKHWDWRDAGESVIEDLILEWPNLKGDDRGLVCLLSAFAFGVSWFVLNIVLDGIFNRWDSVTWEVPMDTGLLILFSLCGTVLGSVAMWCVTTYKLRTLQLRERKEIRETEYNTKLLEKMEHSGGRLTMRELNR